MQKPIGIIDPGHGGTDPGASGNNLIEKDYTLRISLYQIGRFKHLGVPFEITRMTDETLDRVPRTKIVKESGARYCISNHINAASNPSAAGAETIHSIYSDGKLANAIIDELVKEGLPKRRVFSKESTKYPGKDWYYMHRDTGAVETIIVEYDFLTNREGAKRIQENWKRYAEAVVRAVTLYLGYEYYPPERTDENGLETSGTPILGPATATVEQARKWAAKKGTDIEFVRLADIYWRLAPKTGVNPAVAYVQSAHETGFGRFGGVIDKTYKNPCGMKTKNGGDNYDPNAHQRFNSWDEGIQAHLDHLALFAGAPGYPRADTPDLRHFDFITGKAKTVEQLGGKWAPSKTYGEKLVAFFKELEATQITKEEEKNLENEIVRLNLKIVDLENQLQRANAEKLVAQREAADKGQQLRNYDQLRSLLKEFIN